VYKAPTCSSEETHCFEQRNTEIPKTAGEFYSTVRSHCNVSYRGYFWWLDM